MDFIESFESSDVFPVDSPGLGIDDFPLLDSPALVEGEPSVVTSSIPLSMDMTLGRLLNCVRWTTVGCSSCPFRRAIDSFLPSPVGLAGGDDAGGKSAMEALDTMDNESVEYGTSVDESEFHASFCGEY